MATVRLPSGVFLHEVTVVDSEKRLCELYKPIRDVLELLGDKIKFPVELVDLPRELHKPFIYESHITLYPEHYVRTIPKQFVEKGFNSVKLVQDKHSTLRFLPDGLVADSKCTFGEHAKEFMFVLPDEPNFGHFYTHLHPESGKIKSLFLVHFAEDLYTFVVQGSDEKITFTVANFHRLVITRELMQTKRSTKKYYKD